MPTDTIFRPPGTALVGIGSTINRRFVLECLIARGGMGIVFKAKDLRKEEADDRDPYVAVKILTEDFRRHPDALITLQREAKKAQKLAHPNIVTVYDFDRDGDTVYMTMELLEGEPLPQVIKRAYPSGLPAKEAFAIIEGICFGLAYAHKQHIVHSDLKPGNVFVTKEGVAKVLDFGIARAARQPGQLQQDATVFDAGRLGAFTPAYASCDMLEGADPDPRDDIFALACVSYELLTGRHPFAKAPSTQARDNKVQAKPPRNLSREQWRGLLRGLAFARDRRTPTVEEFLRELRPKTPGSARRWVYGTGGAALGIALAAFVATSLMQSQDAEMSSGPCDVSPGPLAAQLRPKVRTLLEVANVHFLVGRIMEPPGSSAFDAYRRVLELHPHNAQACAGLESIARHYEQQAQENIASGRIDDARVQIDNGLRAQPNDARLLKLQQEYGT
ncbi:MAG: protein kinase domain-containing protein [Gammaproteobacteria bacterium]